MPRYPHQLPQVLLPKRLPDRSSAFEGVSAALAGPMLADHSELFGRIDALPGVHSVVTGVSGQATMRDYYLDRDHVGGGASAFPYPFCRIDEQAIVLLNLAPPDKDEVLRKGWGTADGETLCVFLPRDTIETEVAWRVILLSYRFQTTRAAATVRRALPQVASTTRYWV